MYDRKTIGTKDLLYEGEIQDWKIWLKHNTQKIKIVAFGPIISRHIDENTSKSVTGFIFWLPISLWAVTAAMKIKGTCSSDKKL